MIRVEVREVLPSLALEGSFGRESFSQFFGAFVGELRTLEEELNEREKTREEVKHWGESYLVELREACNSAAEMILFEDLWALFSLKHGFSQSEKIAQRALTTAEKRREKDSGKFLIESLGVLGVGKTVLIKSLANGFLEAEFVGEAYPDNPFLKASYEGEEVAVRSQLFFLLKNIWNSIDTQAREGKERWAKDTSPLSDAFIFFPWMRASGKIDEQEAKLYLDVLAFLWEVVPKPDLLVVLRPASIELLEEGIRERALACGGEKGERGYELDLSRKELERFIDQTDRAIEELERLGLKTLILNVDPGRLYADPKIRYAIGYEVRRRLGILGELIDPPPEQTVEEIRKMLIGKQGKVFFLHSPTMYTGRSEILRQLKDWLKTKMIIFRPALSIRPEFGEKGTVMITRDGHRTEAVNIGEKGEGKEGTNDIRRVLEIIKERGITSEKVPVLAFDEGMLFAGNDGNPQEIIETLEALMAKGFNIIYVGVDYTFKGHSFLSYMVEVLEWANQNPDAYLRMVTTRCQFCGKVAMCTRRVTKEGEIAPYDGPNVQVGDSYVPVCDEEDLSCKGRPSDVTKPSLPLDKWLSG